MANSFTAYFQTIKNNSVIIICQNNKENKYTQILRMGLSKWKDANICDSFFRLKHLFMMSGIIKIAKT